MMMSTIDDCGLLLIGKCRFLNELLEQSKERENNIEFAFTGSTFCCRDKKEQMILTAELAVEDPRMEKHLRVADSGFAIELFIYRKEEKLGVCFPTDIGTSVTLTPNMLLGHDKTKPLTCGFMLGVASCPINSEMKVEFKKIGRNDFVISHVEIRVTKCVYELLGRNLNKMGKDVLGTIIQRDCNSKWPRT